MTARKGAAAYDPRDAEQRAELVRALDAARERIRLSRRQLSFDDESETMGA